MEFLTVKEASELLRVTKVTLYKLIKNGEISAIRLGWVWRIPKEDIQKLIVKQQTQSK
jgi:excisionase family DNA binding protein